MNDPKPSFRASSSRFFVFSALALAACGGSMQPPADSGVTPSDVASNDAAPTDASELDSGLPVDASTEDSAVEDVAVSTDTGVAPADVIVTPPDSATPGTDFAAMGPLATSVVGPLSLDLPTSTGCSGQDCRVNVTITVPTGSAPGRAAPFPVAVVSNGFQVPASQYASYAQRLARWGYVVLRWDIPSEMGGIIPRGLAHRTLGAMLRALPERVAMAPMAPAAMMDTTRVVFAGHSRGGKISALAVSGNSNARAYVGFDPVDALPPGTAPGPDYPSGAAALAMYRGRTVILGAALGNMSMFGMPCAPTASNYQTFFTMSASPSLEVTLAQTGHMQFLDTRASCTTACFFCPAGSTTDAAVREVSQVLLVAASEAGVRGADASAYLSPAGAWLSRQTIAMSRLR
ncbi:MAG: hypothetical protein JNK05_41505 [Myxococcales bacterium]|nr:hypothetical protein [Myxococcales bacterium]